MTARAHADTTDTWLAGMLELRQPKAGYRVNVDSLLLIAFAGERRVARAIDLGAGVGVLGLLAWRRGIARELLLIEAQAELAELARHNLEKAAAPGEVLELELGAARLRTSSAELVLCNPPYYPPQPERRVVKGQKPTRARARSGPLAPFLKAAAAVLARKTGRALFCYPAPRLPELLEQAAREQLVPKRLRFVHARIDAPARLALVELRVARPGGLVIEPPLVEWVGTRRSPELLKLTGDRANDRK